SISLFSHKSGMKVFANQGDIEVQAQNANLNMAAKQDIKIDSVDGKLTVTASKALTLMCGGSYIKLSGEGIELGTAENVYIKSNALQKMGPTTQDNEKRNFTKNELEVSILRLINSHYVNFSG
ncbi:uncharacterized protein DUF2345, partial [Frischella perrara]